MRRPIGPRNLGATLGDVSLDLSVEQGVATILLDRSEVMNALDDRLGSQLLESVDKAAADDQVRCIVVTGAGRAFWRGRGSERPRLGLREWRGPRSGPDPHRQVQPVDPAIRQLRQAGRGGAQRCGRGGRRQHRPRVRFQDRCRARQTHPRLHQSGSRARLRWAVVPDQDGRCPARAWELAAGGAPGFSR